jgi:hypothetical protein
MKWQSFKQQQQAAGSSANPRNPRPMGPNPGFAQAQPTSQPAGQAAQPYIPPVSGSTSQIACSVPGCNEAQIDPSAGTLAPSTGVGGLVKAGVPMGTGTSQFGKQSQSANPNPNAADKVPKV